MRGIKTFCAFERWVSVVDASADARATLRTVIARMRKVKTYHAFRAWVARVADAVEERRKVDVAARWRTRRESDRAEAMFLAWATEARDAASFKLSLIHI